MARCYRALVYLHYGVLLIWMAYVPFFVLAQEARAIPDAVAPCMSVGDSCMTVANCNPPRNPPCVCEKVGATRVCNTADSPPPP
jgi:hypothetical protein